MSTSHRLGPLVLIATITCSCGGTPTHVAIRINEYRRSDSYSGTRSGFGVAAGRGCRVTIVDGPLAGLTTTTNDIGRFAFLSLTASSPDLTILFASKKTGRSPVTTRWHKSNEVSVILSALTVDSNLDSTIHDYLCRRSRVCGQLPSTVRTLNLRCLDCTDHAGSHSLRERVDRC